MGKLTDKVILVTGASKGIGRGIVRGLAAEGATLVLTGRDESGLAMAKDDAIALGAEVTVIPADVKEESQILSIFDRIKTDPGRLDILVNNAGTFEGGPLSELSTSDWDHVLSINLRAPFIFTREAMRMMIPQGGGRIINVGSISAQRVRPLSGPYSSSKHGLWGLTQVTALEGREHNITCGCVHPGNVLTERRQSSDKPEDAEPMMTVDELAETVVLMATLPPHVNLLEAIVLPKDQLYVGRG